MLNLMPSLGGLSPVSGKNVVVDFDGGVLPLREIEERMRVTERMAAYLKDPRARADHAQPRRHHPLSSANDLGGLRGRQRRRHAAQRADVQDGARSDAIGS
jgi:hypothetical protein